MLTRRSSTAAWPASGDQDRTSVTRCPKKNTPSGPAGARTATALAESKAAADALRAMIKRMLEPDPSKRPTFPELLEELT